jgi:hypothetical protein
MKNNEELKKKLAKCGKIVRNRLPKAPPPSYLERKDPIQQAKEEFERRFGPRPVLTKEERDRLFYPNSFILRPGALSKYEARVKGEEPPPPPCL